MKKISAGITAGALALFVSALVSGNAFAEHRGAASRLETVKQNYLAHERAENWKKNGSFEVAEGAANSSSQWLTKVSARDVNMVTNTSCDDAKGIEISGRTYYVPEAYAGTLHSNQTLRYAKDPVTEKRVDKGEAVIFADASGRVYYFESEDTYREFISLGGTESAKAY